MAYHIFTVAERLVLALAIDNGLHDLEDAVLDGLERLLGLVLLLGLTRGHADREPVWWPLTNSPRLWSVQL